MHTQTTQTETVKVVTVNELEEILKAITKSTIINVTYLVDDPRSKQVKGNRQVQKLVNVTNVYLNHDYTKKVINLTGNENFVAHELKGKYRICGTLLGSEKTNEVMIDGKVLYSEASKILALYHNGKEITEAEGIAMELWAPSYYKPTETTTMGRGTVSEDDNFGIINTYLKRIVRAKIEGEHYLVK